MHLPLSQARKHHVLYLLRIGKYSVDLEKGIVLQSNGEPLQPYTKKHNLHRYLFVRLRDGPTQIRILVAHVVWMAKSKTPIPDGFEVHHRDRNPKNNSAKNLMCLHSIDHQEEHSQEEVPF